ncbi:MAG: ABC-2 transporter permease, partial [Bacillota bacterium]
MIGLILKDFYTIRQYSKTMLFMLVFFALISAGLDNPAAFFEGFIIIMSTMMSIYSFSYDNLAKWDRYGLSLPVTRKEVVASKYILSLLLCLIGAV